MRKRIAWILASPVVLLILIQLVPVPQTNPPVESEPRFTPEVRAVLQRACFDCHSNETIWPWYSRIAPVSWLVYWDVNEGRTELNYSEWNRLSRKERSRKLKESWETISEGEMPPWIYFPTHPEARLSEADRALLKDWFLSAAGTDYSGQD